MKKIILLFLLFTLSLFSQFEKKEYGFTIEIKDQYDFGYILYLTAAQVNNKVSPRLRFTLASLSIDIEKKKPVSIQFNGSQVWFGEDGKFSASIIDGDAYHSLSEGIELPNCELKKLNNKLLTITIPNAKWVKQILKEITEKRFIILFEDESGGFFDLSKYKKDILESDFYKNIN